MSEGYGASQIQILEGLEAVRRRPGMYIGSTSAKGLHHLVYEIVDNSVDEALAGYCDHIEVTINKDNSITVVDNGRGIPVGIQAKAHKPAVEVVFTILHAGGKFGGGGYKVSGGLHGVGASVVNALSEWLEVNVYVDGYEYYQRYERGKVMCELQKIGPTEKRGTTVHFLPDKEIFEETVYDFDTLKIRLRETAFLTKGLKITLRDGREEKREKTFHYEGGIREFVEYLNRSNVPLYEHVFYCEGQRDGVLVEVAMQHNDSYTENIYSFVNNINTPEGGTHLTGFKNALTKTFNDYGRKNKLLKENEPALSGEDIREGLTAIISIKVEEPVFESQTKTKLGSKDMGPDGPSVGKFIGDFIKKELDNYLHKNAETSDALLRKIQESEKERKAIAGVTKLARERAKKANLHNKKLRDCRIHLNDTKGDNLEDSCIFITEGDSASGSITKSRDPNLQAVFSLRGKPLNSFGLTKKIVYENEEFNLLQAALNIEDGLEGLRYNKVIIATDADVDGMHIRLLLITFFLQFFPDLIKRNHVYILQTPLFRVRNKQKTWYCYSEEERVNAIAAAGKNAEITRFKGLGEISPDEFKHFIGKDIRLDPVTMKKEDLVKDMLEFYMGKNTMERQNFIIDNLVVEEDVVN